MLSGPPSEKASPKTLTRMQCVTRPSLAVLIVYQPLAFRTWLLHANHSVKGSACLLSSFAVESIS